MKRVLAGCVAVCLAAVAFLVIARVVPDVDFQLAMRMTISVVIALAILALATCCVAYAGETHRPCDLCGEAIHWWHHTARYNCHARCSRVHGKAYDAGRARGEEDARYRRRAAEETQAQQKPAGKKRRAP